MEVFVRKSLKFWSRQRWYFVRIAENGEPISRSSEMYRDHNKALAAAQLECQPATLHDEGL